MREAREDRTTTLDGAAIDRHANTRIWEDCHDTAGSDARWKAINGLPKRERIALAIYARVNPLNTSERVTREFARAMAEAAGLRDRKWRWELVRRARARLAGAARPAP